MRTNQSARYARWSAIVALVLALIVTGVYERRTRHSRRTEPTAAPVPASVEEQSAGFSLSKVTGQETQYTVRAAHATQFKEGGLSLLQNVWITAFGKAAERFDNMQSGACNYVSDTGLFTCAGPVQMDLQSSEDAREHPSREGTPAPAAHIIHISTSEIAFDGQSGVATTKKPVAFRLPQGDGNAVGAIFESKLGGLHLLHDVHLTLQAAAPTAPAPPSGAAPTNLLGSVPVDISGTSLDFDRQKGTIHISGPVTATQGTRTLHSGKLDVLLDDKLKIRHIIATDHPVLNSVDDAETSVLTAEVISATLSADGWMEQVTAETNVHSDRKGPAGQDHMTARHVQLDYSPGTNQLHRITARDDVKVRSDLVTGASRRLATSTVVMDFVPVPDSKDVRLAQATTPQATLDSYGSVLSAGKATPERMTLISQQLKADFGEQSDLQKLFGWNGVEMQRQLGDQPAATSTSHEMVATFIPGDWSTVEQTGDVRLRNVDKSAESPHAFFDHVPQTATLAGPVTLTDPSSRTTANAGKFLQADNEFEAEGNVVTTEIQDASTSTPDPRGPARVSSDHLVANTMTGHAVYSGHARLWQGDSLVQGDVIELDRTLQTMTANGRVRAIFPKEQTTSAGAASPPKHTGKPGAQPEFVHTESERLIYDGIAHRAHLEQNAMARTDEGTIHSPSLDLYFVPNNPANSAQSSTQNAAKPSSTAAGPASKSSSPLTSIGNQTFDHAIALGGVLVDDGIRQGKSARADYTAADGKFVLSGDHPEVRDSLGNVTNGRQLTFIFDDDSIVVDSEEGSRTLTLHRVEK